MAPNVCVELVELVIHDKTVFVVGNLADGVPCDKSREALDMLVEKCQLLGI